MCRRRQSHPHQSSRAGIFAEQSARVDDFPFCIEHSHRGKHVRVESQPVRRRNVDVLIEMSDVDEDDLVLVGEKRRHFPASTRVGKRQRPPIVGSPDDQHADVVGRRGCNRRIDLRLRVTADVEEFLRSSGKRLTGKENGAENKRADGGHARPANSRVSE